MRFVLLSECLRGLVGGDPSVLLLSWVFVFDCAESCRWRSISGARVGKDSMDSPQMPLDQNPLYNP